MTVLITLTTAGTDSGPFDLYSDLDGYLSAFESGVSKAALEAGYASSSVPDYTNIIRVKSNGAFCTNYVNIPVGSTTTTTTTTTVTPPWNSLTATREPAVISNSSSALISGACGFDLSGIAANHFIATQIPGILSVGDRVFMTDLPGVVPFDGTVFGTPRYWALYLAFGFEICPLGLNQIALIDEQGFILEVQCCPV